MPLCVSVCVCCLCVDIKMMSLDDHARQASSNTTNEVCLFFKIISLSDISLKKKHIYFIYTRLFCSSHTCYCVGMVSVTSASRCVTSASRY